MNLNIVSCFSPQGDPSISEDKTNEDAEENVGDPANGDDEQQVKVVSSTEIRELYAITPPASFTDSSEEDDGSTEISPLVRKEATLNETVPSTELPEPSTSRSSTSWETRPLLSRQIEIDQASQSSKDTNANSLDQDEAVENSSRECPRVKVPNSLNIAESDDQLESQRVTPILFTLSPTKKGTSQVVSVIATRDLPAAFSRPSSMPNSPCARKPKVVRIPKSPKSFRGMFGFRGSSEKDIDNTSSDSNSRTSNGNISTANAATIDSTASENTLIDSSNNIDVCAKNEDVVANCDMQLNGTDLTNNHHRKSDCTCCTINHSATCSASNPENAHSSAERNTSKSMSIEDALIVFHSEPLPARSPISSQRTSHRDSLSEKELNTNDSFEESTNNSDKGYESVDNSPCVENDEGICRSLITSGTKPPNGISKLAQNGILEQVAPNGLDDIAVTSSEPKRSVWLPLSDSKAPLGRNTVTTVTAGKQDSNLFSQTAV